MKKIKSMLALVTIVVMIFATSGCKDCDGDSPRARIINNGTKVISVQIKTSGGNTENINNIQPSTISEYRSFAAGSTTFTISIGNEVVETIIQMDNCFEYDITIDKNNVIVTSPRDRNE